MGYYNSGTGKLECGNWNLRVCRKWKRGVDHPVQSIVVSMGKKKNSSCLWKYYFIFQTTAMERYVCTVHFIKKNIFYITKCIEKCVHTQPTHNGVSILFLMLIWGRDIEQPILNSETTVLTSTSKNNPFSTLFQS